VDCKKSEFNQFFNATTHLDMFALLFSSWFGYIYDVQVDKWHKYEIDEELENVQILVGAE